MEKTLILTTPFCSLHSEVVGLVFADPILYKNRVGETSPSYPTTPYKTVLDAQRDGWRLIGPPSESKETINDFRVSRYTWYLTKL